MGLLSIPRTLLAQDPVGDDQAMPPGKGRVEVQGGARPRLEPDHTLEVRNDNALVRRPQRVEKGDRRLEREHLAELCHRIGEHDRAVDLGDNRRQVERQRVRKVTPVDDLHASLDRVETDRGVDQIEKRFAGDHLDVMAGLGRPSEQNRHAAFADDRAAGNGIYDGPGGSTIDDPSRNRSINGVKILRHPVQVIAGHDRASAGQIYCRRMSPGSHDDGRIGIDQRLLDGRGDSLDPGGAEANDCDGGHGGLRRRRRANTIGD